MNILEQNFSKSVTIHNLTVRYIQDRDSVHSSIISSFFFSVPNPPENLNVKSVSNDAVTVSWNEVHGNYLA